MCGITPAPVCPKLTQHGILADDSDDYARLYEEPKVVTNFQYINAFDIEVLKLPPL